MNHTILAVAAVLTLAVAPAAAQETDAETRFHRAYETEVVDGKLADAAREYLALMRDADVPAPLRAESKFRFAVTALLLGRSDEARAHLAELVRDPQTPDALRARAGEYLDAAKGIGVGTELDRKLQSLVFDLAKEQTGAEAVPPAYRDFEVIGKAAVPFLKRLLAHDDRALRHHALRILVRMGEPGLMELWSPEIAVLSTDLRTYLRDRPDQAAILERKVLALPDEQFKQMALWWNALPSAEFLRQAERRGVDGEALIKALTTHVADPAARMTLALEWMGSARNDVAAPATLAVLRASREGVPEGVGPGATLPLAVERLTGRSLPWGSLWEQKSNLGEWRGFVNLARAAPLESVVDALEQALRQGAATDGDWSKYPLTNGIAGSLTRVLIERNPGDAPLARFASLLRDWVQLADRVPAAATPEFTLALAFALRALPLDDARKFVQWLVAPRTDGSGAVVRRWRNALPQAPETDQEVAVLLAAFDAMDVTSKYTVIWQGFVPLALRLPQEEAATRLVETVSALRALAPKLREEGLRMLLARKEDRLRPEYWAKVVLPAMDRLWAMATPEEQAIVVDEATRLLGADSLEDRLRVPLARFVLDHVELVPPDDVAGTLLRHPDLLPLEAWMLRVPDATFHELQNESALTQDRVVAAVRDLTKDPANVHVRTLWLLRRLGPEAAQAEIAERLVRAGSPETVRAVFDAELPVSIEQWEEVLAREIARTPADREFGAGLVRHLVERAPSERLLPAVRFLLQAPSEPEFDVGINMAKSLGREELLPDLARALDSMDEDVRQHAREAIDSIVELRRLREEARRNAAGPR